MSEENLSAIFFWLIIALTDFIIGYSMGYFNGKHANQ